jgi:hypothetical protein
VAAGARATGAGGDALFARALVAFRTHLITHTLDRVLVSRTVEVAKLTGKFGWQPLQAALDSSPLIGAGRVEDTWNFLVHDQTTFLGLTKCVSRVQS